MYGVNYSLIKYKCAGLQMYTCVSMSISVSLLFSLYIFLDHNIYFTTTTKGIKNRTEHKITIHTALLLLVGTDVCVRKVFV